MPKKQPKENFLHLPATKNKEQRRLKCNVIYFSSTLPLPRVKLENFYGSIIIFLNLFSHNNNNNNVSSNERYFQGDDEKNTRKIFSVMKLIKKLCIFLLYVSSCICVMKHIFNGIWNLIFLFIYWRLIECFFFFYLHILISNIITSSSFAMKLLLINKVSRNSSLAVYYFYFPLFIVNYIITQINESVFNEEWSFVGCWSIYIYCKPFLFHLVYFVRKL